ncbi:cation:proton antiporter [Roseovarius sp. S1116L3]|uniref:cation:proton antiporter domain-containing protein n=1 Tax=Roseovarius roseus TaxID=3342636 RepID=UPI00372AD45F
MVAGGIAGLGKEVGGLLAGVALASTPYRENIAARLALLRDCLLHSFFIALGSALDLSLLDAHVTGAAVFSLLEIIGNPLAVRRWREDTRRALIRLTRMSGFPGRVAVASHHPRDT